MTRTRQKRWTEYSTDEIPQLVQELPVALLPLGAVEEHGPHLPVGTDILVADRLAERVAARTGVILLPCLHYGQVWSLSRFPGSVGVSETTLRAMLIEIAQSLASQGIRGLAFLSGHLGNLSAMREAARTLKTACPGLIVQTMAYPQLDALQQGILESPRWHPQFVHADEFETSILLALAPEYVRMEKAQAEYPPLPPDFAVSPWFWDEFGDRLSGVFGDPTVASADKGHRLLDRLEEIVVGYVLHLIERVRGRPADQ